MTKSSRLYPWVSRLAAVVLLSAGALKAYDVQASPPEEGAGWQAALSVFELILGAWLLAGLFPRWTRLVTLVCFGVFLHVAFGRALAGEASCGCFGSRFMMRPWAAVAVDAVILAALLFSPPERGPDLPALRGVRWRWAGVGLASVLVAGWVGQLLLPATVTPGQERGQQAIVDDLTRVINALDRNHASLNTVVYTTTQNHASREIVELPGRDRKTPARPTEKLFQSTARSVVRGGDIKREYMVRDGKEAKDANSRETLVGIRGRRIQHMPGHRQAWLMTSSVDADRLEATDLRCAGFRPPITSIADWVRGCEVRSVGQAADRLGRDVVRVRAMAHPPTQPWKDDVEVDFVPSFGYLPSRIVTRFTASGSVWSVIDIEYDRVGPNRAWFPKQITTRYFTRDAAVMDPDAQEGWNIWSKATVQVLAVGEPVSDDVFDPVLPPKTRLLGDLAAKQSTGDAAIRASAVMREQPRQLSAPPRAESASAFWFPVVFDVLLLVLCAVCHHRFAVWPISCGRDCDKGWEDD